MEAGAVQLVRDMQKLREFDGGDSEEVVGRRQPIHNIERHRQKKAPIGTLDVAFMKRFHKMKESSEGNNNISVLYL